jgi:Cu/Zn superoxide dismutase
MKKMLLMPLFILLAFVFVGCSDDDDEAPITAEGAVTVEMSQIYDVQDNETPYLGYIKIFAMKGDADGLYADIKLNGFSAGSHGFHVHENDNCSDTGPHYDNKVTDPERDRGALINLTASSQGVIDLYLKPISDTLKISEVYGRTLVIHGSEDNSTVKFACGVIPTL